MAKEIAYDICCDLDDLIDKEIVNLLGDEEDDEFDTKVTTLNSQIKNAERKPKEIKKILEDCRLELAKYQEYLDTEEREEARIHDATSAEEDCQSAIVCDDSDDDDIQFVGTSYEPRQQKAVNIPTTNRAPSPKPVVSNGVQAYSASPKMDSCRQALTAAIKKQLPENKSVIQQQNQPQQRQNYQQSAQAGQNQARAPPRILKPPPVGSSQTPNSAQSKPLNDPNQPIVIDDAKDELDDELDVSTQVYAQKANDIWYPGVVIELLQNSKHKKERKYKIKFDNNKGWKCSTARKTAYRQHMKYPASVGTRVVALYRDEETGAASSHYAGILAECPSGRNSARYLVFFDDGYAQYSTNREIHRVYYQSPKVWDDIHPDSQDFIREYLAQYPERPMVRLQKGQTIKVEWNGRWWTAKVVEVDASLVKMFFPSDRRTEWIYRGSTRLEPLYTALANAEANIAAGKGKRHNIMKKDKNAVVEYTGGDVQACKQLATQQASHEEQLQQTQHQQTQYLQHQQAVARQQDQQQPAAANRQQIHVIPDSPPKNKPDAGPPRKRKESETEGKKKSIAKKSTSGAKNEWEGPWVKMQKKPEPPPPVKLEKPEKTKEKFQASSISSSKVAKDMATVIQERLSLPEFDEEGIGTRVENKACVKDAIRKEFFPHTCGKKCLIGQSHPDKFKGNNRLLVPLLCGWERHVCKTRPNARRGVIYRGPCARRLRNMFEVDAYLVITGCDLTVDQFCFDPQLHVHTEFVPVKTFCDIKDLSYGRETIPISCVNGYDRQYPDYVEYSNRRIPSKGVNLNIDPDFMCGCTCKDNCQDRDNCECVQLTREATSNQFGGAVDPDAGFKYRCLEEPHLTGVYECNQNCKCNFKCPNRVTQMGLTRRLQVFRTEKKGWGLRCLDDIPSGGFICIYAGQLLTEQGANEDGQQYGDEYLAELDYIEVVEQQKEGYESDVNEDKGLGDSGSDRDSEETESDNECDKRGAEDSDFSEREMESAADSSNRTHFTRGSRTKSKDKKGDGKKGGDKKPPADVKLPSVASSDELPDLTSSPHDRRHAKRSTVSTHAKTHRFRNLPDPKARTKDDSMVEPPPEEIMRRFATRELFGDNEACYIMDAKSMGNLGRYLNHSCTPNVFVQNVFVDTHDLRFPWVAFFAGQFIRAGTELTWDYNYEVGSVPGKRLYCYCGTPECRGRLL